jgi:hypothetical protein
MGWANLNIDDLSPDVVAEHSSYHSGRASKSWHVPAAEKEFIAWDGEGLNFNGPHKPQSYVLFGCSTGEYITAKGKGHLHTFELLDFIISVGARNPAAFHVGYAFGYDTNMIVRSLSDNKLRQLHQDGHCYLRRVINEKPTWYRIAFRPGKMLTVSRYGEKHSHKGNSNDKVTVTIYDMFSFFGTSFIKAYEDLVGAIPQTTKDGKAKRAIWSVEDWQDGTILHYWQEEIGLLRDLAVELRTRMYGAGLLITQWYGPGALASYVLKREGVKAHMAEAPDAVRNASRHAYAGGRFELFKVGRVEGPIYGLDINSAYPYGITRLPSLTHGRWAHTVAPTDIKEFGVYRVRMLPRPGGSLLERAAGPLFHRDRLGNITFPWVTDGWYWTPEVKNLMQKNYTFPYEIVEGWEWLPTSNIAPYAWVGDMYKLRKQWKAEGNASQLALKLCMNSLYGKMAQRVGWNEERRTAPGWHQLEWAGWVTSHTRAMLWNVMSCIPTGEVIAVETDGLYTTVHPERLGITGNSDLGGWEVEVYDEIMYVQSGLAWLRKGDRWVCKRRGLDAGTFELDSCRAYLESLQPKERWKPFVGRTTRFIGLGAALGSSAPTKQRHCVWQTTEREINVGKEGKRFHFPAQCRACRLGKNAYEMAHDLTIRSAAMRGEPQSYPHDIPWENGEQGYTWRQQPDEGIRDYREAT